MKKNLEKIIDLLPYSILIILVASLIIFIYLRNLSYEYLIGIIKTIIWPAVVLSALLFFKKVFVYMFFSMREFNFFGAKGELRDVTEVIESKVQERIKQIKDQEKTNLEIDKFAKELEKASEELKNVNTSKQNIKKEEDENLQIARDIFKKYSELSKQNSETLKELNDFRRQKQERDARVTEFRERIRLRRNEESHDQKEILSDTPKANKPISQKS